MIFGKRTDICLVFVYNREQWGWTETGGEETCHVYYLLKYWNCFINIFYKTIVAVIFDRSDSFFHSPCTMASPVYPTIRTDRMDKKPLIFHCQGMLTGRLKRRKHINYHKEYTRKNTIRAKPFKPGRLTPAQQF